MKKYFLIAVFELSGVILFAQKDNWQNLDMERDSVFGISIDRAYKELLSGKKSESVLVAIIDSGLDTSQEDIKSKLWTNLQDGTHGWNYIGEERGREDITRIIAERKDFYDSLQYTLVPEVYRSGYQFYRKLSPALESKISAMNGLINELEEAKKLTDDIIRRLGKVNPTVEDFKNFQTKSNLENKIIRLIINGLPNYLSWKEYKIAEIDGILDKARYHLQHGLNLENLESDTSSGESDISPDKLGLVEVPNYTAWHGTHVAGIIGAKRNNGIGIDGIADNVKIMMLKVNGTIRELRDESLAKAIRFAVDHGSKVINLSFGKPYSWNKAIVDEAVKYAMERDVLLVHAAGNAGINLDNEEHFPNRVYLDKSGEAEAWIEVGASGIKDDSALVARFSNYGKHDVDVFAPGVAIRSTVPFNQYQSWDGTSMATPIVAGLAAVIREYYPKLTAVQVKDIIIKSVVKVNHTVYVRKDGDLKQVAFSELCVSGGIVNAYQALKLAAELINKYDNLK